MLDKSIRCTYQESQQVGACQSLPSRPALQQALPGGGVAVHLLTQGLMVGQGGGLEAGLVALLVGHQGGWGSGGRERY